MKRHAAITQHDDTDRIGEVVIKIIKQHIDKPAADDDADNPHIDKGIKRRRTDNIPGALRQPLEQHPADQHTEKISQRIPVNFKAENREGHLVDGRKGQGSLYRRVQIVRCKQVHADHHRELAPKPKDLIAHRMRGIEKTIRLIRFASLSRDCYILCRLSTVGRNAACISPGGGVITANRGKA